MFAGGEFAVNGPSLWPADVLVTGVARLAAPYVTISIQQEKVRRHILWRSICTATFPACLPAFWMPPPLQKKIVTNWPQALSLSRRVYSCLHGNLQCVFLHDKPCCFILLLRPGPRRQSAVSGKTSPPARKGWPAVLECGCLAYWTLLLNLRTVSYLIALTLASSTVRYAAPRRSTRLRPYTSFCAHRALPLPIA